MLTLRCRSCLHVLGTQIRLLVSAWKHVSRKLAGNFKVPLESPPPPDPPSSGKKTPSDTCWQRLELFSPLLPGALSPLSVELHFTPRRVATLWLLSTPSRSVGFSRATGHLGPARQHDTFFSAEHRASRLTTWHAVDEYVLFIWNCFIHTTCNLHKADSGGSIWTLI